MRQRLERFLIQNRYKGVPGLMTIVVFGTAVCYVLSLVPELRFLPAYLMFDRASILRGEVWRLLTFIFMPQGFLGLQGVIFTALSLFFYYWIGSTLEREWGPLKFNLYYLIGVLLLWVVGFAFNLSPDAGYLNLSLFFAFATLYPDMQIRLFLILPVKIKWMAWLDLVYFIVSVAASPGWYRLVPVVALLGYAIFFWGYWLDFFRGRVRRHTSGQARRAINFKKAVHDKRAAQGYIHKCAVCGKTDADSPGEEFRYCSVCRDYACYCSEHLFNHEHHL
jgi:hypothetical protein